MPLSFRLLAAARRRPQTAAGWSSYASWCLASRGLRCLPSCTTPVHHPAAATERVRSSGRGERTASLRCDQEAAKASNRLRICLPHGCKQRRRSQAQLGSAAAAWRQWPETTTGRFALASRADANHHTAASLPLGARLGRSHDRHPHKHGRGPVYSACA